MPTAHVEHSKQKDLVGSGWKVLPGEQLVSTSSEQEVPAGQASHVVSDVVVQSDTLKCPAMSEANRERDYVPGLHAVRYALQCKVKL